MHARAESCEGKWWVRANWWGPRLWAETTSTIDPISAICDLHVCVMQS